MLHDITSRLRANNYRPRVLRGMLIYSSVSSHLSTLHRHTTALDWSHTSKFPGYWGDDQERRLEFLCSTGVQNMERVFTKNSSTKPRQSEGGTEYVRTFSQHFPHFASPFVCLGI